MKRIIRIIFILFYCSYIIDGYAQYNFSKGLYRIPYEDDAIIQVFSDVWTHDPPGKYDLLTDTNDLYIVAAAPGWVRGIQDGFDVECHAGNGQECCWWFNNYVVLEHPNGEWTEYSHIQYGSAADLGLEINQWVEAGDPIGIEGSVGCSAEPHLHFMVSTPPAIGTPFDTIGGFLNGQRLIPVICGNLPEICCLITNEEYVTSPCDDECIPIVEVTGNLEGDSLLVLSAGEQIMTDDSGSVYFIMEVYHSFGQAKAFSFALDFV